MATFTPDGFAEALLKFGKELDKPITNAMRRGLHRARNRAGELFRTRGVGRTVFGGKKGKVPVRASFKRTGVKRSGDTFKGGLYVKGLAALQETGGRTFAHVIKPKNKKLLVWATSAGMFAARWVAHPGGKLPAFPVVKRSMNEEAPAIQNDLDMELKTSIWAKGLA